MYEVVQTAAACTEKMTVFFTAWNICLYSKFIAFWVDGGHVTKKKFMQLLHTIHGNFLNKTKYSEFDF